MLSRRKMLVDLAPGELATPDHVGAMSRMHQRSTVVHRGLGVDHVGGLLILDDHEFAGVFGQRARLGYHRHHPFTGVANNSVC